MNKPYQIIERNSKEELTRFLVREGKLLLPMVNLIENARLAVDEVIDVLGRASIEAVLEISAEQVAGPRHQGKKGGPMGWHGKQAGRIALSDRKLRVRKPRIRQCGGGEATIPAYEAMKRDERLGERMLGILMRNVTTRHYNEVIPEMAETVGVSRSSVSRKFVNASEAKLKEMCERRLEHLELLVIFIDGIRLGDHHAIVALGVDTDGKKHILGIGEGATENAIVVKTLLEDLVARGLKRNVRYLFVIDGSKALRSAITTVFGDQHPVQRCRNHKIENVTGHLPKELKEQVKITMKAAYRLEAKEGMARLKKQAEWLEKEHPQAAASLIEGLEETFTVNRLGMSPLLRRSLGTTNLIESPQSIARRPARRVCRWRNGNMVMRWVASAFLAAESRFNRIMGHEDLWMLSSILREEKVDRKEAIA